jgi:hypothetical protein
MGLSSQQFRDLEMSILKRAVDSAAKTRDVNFLKTPDTKRVIRIVEQFLRKGRFVCYGGTAINNILPVKDRFYDEATELPDYDFYSEDAMNDAKKLADIYYKEGFIDVEAKAGVHYGTYKVFVNFIPIADITQMVPEIFGPIWKDSVVRSGIRYAPPNLLRMAMYLELSRPKGDISRWEKVLSRISLLNKNFPLEGKQCSAVDFQRRFSNRDLDIDSVYGIVRNALIDSGVVFFGGFAATVYSRYMRDRDKVNRDPDFDVLSTNPEKTAEQVIRKLRARGYGNIEAFRHDSVGEIVSEHIEITIGGDTVVFIYRPMACHSYNVITVQGAEAKIATIDTILSMYLAFIYTGRVYYDAHRLLCMAEFLFIVQKKNRLSQKGVLKRFSLDCYGEQSTLESMRLDKSEMFEKLKSDRRSDEWNKWFLRYSPNDSDKKNRPVRKPNAQSNRATRNRSTRNRATRSRSSPSLVIRSPGTSPGTKKRRYRSKSTPRSVRT